jgi:Holliday junction resolvasome RuvABC endonuclease subunit
MLILAFDQSIRRTGWCLYEPPSLRSILVGSFTSAPEKEMSTEEKAAIFCDEIEKLFKAHRPNFVVWEAAAEDIRRFPFKPKKDGKQKASIDLLAAVAPEPQKSPASLSVNADQLILRDIQGHIRHAARARRVPYEAVNVKSWRAAILKCGNAGKDEAKAKAVVHCQMLRIPAKNHDQAEAVCVALYGATTQTFRMMQARAA